MTQVMTKIRALHEAVNSLSANKERYLATKKKLKKLINLHYKLR